MSAAGAVLHALDDDERASFEAHLETCEICQRELAEFEETVARLGSAVAELPPSRMRSSVLADIGVTRQLPPQVGRPRHAVAEPTATVDETPTRPVEVVAPLPPEVVDLASRRRRPIMQRVVWMAAAAVVAIAVVIGVSVANRGTPDANSALRECISTATDSRQVAPSDDSVGVSDVTVSADCGGAVIKLSDVPAAPSGHTYQLWVIAGEVPTSVGTMEPDAAGTMPEIVTPLHVGDTAIGVTVEPAGGSATPTTTPVVLIPLAT